MDAYITEEETEALIVNNTTSIFVGNVSVIANALLSVFAMIHFFSPQLLEQAESERNKLRELLVRHSELEKVERSLIEVRDMFLRISTLVIEQVH